ncbi:unnamed protein product [Phytophthora fragariaefolia]|uniref:Unnamed protein product n=1 Tax=Phytophthora fragariaefolia TaxID=1490495 RepID=A0A9W6XKC6_9STRA|nr:unnamed protein product [Phytophthora fragariaefolia]
MRFRRLIKLPILIIAIAFVAQLGEVVDAKRRSSAYSVWASVYTLSESGGPSVRVLRAGDDGNKGERGGLSVPFTEKLKTLASSKVTPEKLQSCLDKGKPADSVFVRMRLDKVESWLIYLDEFPQWLSYVDDLNAKVSTRKNSAMSILSTHFGDAALYKMIEGAQFITRTKDLAAKLEGKLMQHWVATAKDPDDVFRLMELDKIERDLIRNAKFNVWVKYVDDFNARYPEKATTMVPTLRLHRYDDHVLFNMAAAGMKVEATKSAATKLQEQLIYVWLSSRKSPDDALVELGLGQASSKLFENSLFAGWVRYLHAYNAEFPHRQTGVFDMFMRRFGNDNAAWVIRAAKANDATRDVVTKLESAQLKYGGTKENRLMMWPTY